MIRVRGLICFEVYDDSKKDKVNREYGKFISVCKFKNYSIGV